MRQITSITVLGLVLLFVLVASRLLDATDSPSVNRMDKADSSVDSTRVTKEPVRVKESLHDRTGIAGGIWFW